MNKIPFAQLPLSKEVLKSIAEMGFEEATPIQSEAIPLILEGIDITGQSRTGTGKTIAFAVPAVEKADTAVRAVQVLVLCPTRELCIQVTEEINKLGKHKRGLLSLPIYGGQAYDRQIHGLKKGAQIVIGTPGRLMDHMKRGTLKLDAASMVILDEADEMLDMGFQDDLEFILKSTPATRQTILFSATMPPGIRHLIKKYQKDPRSVKIAHDALTVPETRQFYVEVKHQMKLEALCRFLDFHSVKVGIVFCNTRIGVDELVGHLQARGYSSDGLHGDIKQNMRDKVMGRFRSGQVEILVATDVASRGIDVKNVEAVFNYDLPKDEEDYVHRIGRTGRAGRPGLAISFVTGRDAYKLREIERFTKVKVPRQAIPSFDDVEATQHTQMLEKVKEVLREGHLAKYSVLVDRLMEEEFTAIDVAAALLKMALPKMAEPARVETSRERGVGLLDGGIPAKISLSVGRMQGVRAKDILGALTGETGLRGAVFGGIEIGSKFTTVEVPEEHAEEIITKIMDARIKGVKVKARRAT
jgi:ATP-dependent RNA helicase DeaD